MQKESKNRIHRNEIVINEELLQSYAEQKLKRLLDPEELEEAYCWVLEGVVDFIRDRIDDMFEAKEIEECGERAKKSGNYFEIHVKRPEGGPGAINHYGPFANYNDARTFMHLEHLYILKVEDWRIVKMEKNMMIFEKPFSMISD